MRDFITLPRKARQPISIGPIVAGAQCLKKCPFRRPVFSGESSKSTRASVRTARHRETIHLAV